MTKIIALATLLVSAAASAAPVVLTGKDALVMTKILDDATKTLSYSEKKRLGKIFAGDCGGKDSATTLRVEAKEIVCAFSSVAVGSMHCEITSPAGKTKTIRGVPAYTLDTLLGVAGIEDDGAAGTIYRMASATCVIQADNELLCGGYDSAAQCTVAPAEITSI